MTIDAFPLQWPAGFQRTPAGERKEGRFYGTGRGGGGSYKVKKALTIAAARDRIYTELERFHAEAVVISSNVPLNMRGEPQGGAANPIDPGVAVYFHLKGEPHCLPCDRWTLAAQNMAAVAAHLDAMRGMERWGVGDLRHAFAGYKRLEFHGENPPNPGVIEPPIDWREILNLQNAVATPSLVKLVWKGEMAKAVDNESRQVELNRAKDAALEELGA